MMNFVVIGELADKLSGGYRDSTHHQIDSVKIIGFRNIITHNYFGVDAQEAWQIIGDSLFGKEKYIKTIIGKYYHYP